MVKTVIEKIKRPHYQILVIIQFGASGLAVSCQHMMTVG